MNTPTLNHYQLPPRKFCCDGLHTKLVTPIKTMVKKKVSWRRAIYRCSKCHEFTIRGEAKLPTNNTSVEVITKMKADGIIEAKKVFVERMKKK